MMPNKTMNLSGRNVTKRNPIDSKQRTLPLIEQKKVKLKNNVMVKGFMFGTGEKKCKIAQRTEWIS